MDKQRFVIVTDSNNDMPESWLREHEIIVLPYYCTIGGATYPANDPAMPFSRFYGMMRQGEAVSTSQVNVRQAVEALAPLLEAGNDILCLSFSSGLSGGYSAMLLAQEKLRAKYPGRQMAVVDTLAASMGQGLLVYQAVLLRGKGLELEATVGWLEENKLHAVHIFTVDDLEYLHRGGRVSKASAVIGSVLGIKPILHVDDAGKLVSIGKVRGRRQSLNAMADEMAARIGQWENPVALISHGDCLEDAQYLEGLVKERFGVGQVMVNYIDTTIGAHSGPGTVALFFMGDRR